MKHTPQITFERATCICGHMPGIWRNYDESIGAFTLRSHAIWEEHKSSTPEPPIGNLFDYRAASEPAQSMQDTLFG